MRDPEIRLGATYWTRVNSSWRQVSVLSEVATLFEGAPRRWRVATGVRMGPPMLPRTARELRRHRP